LIVAFASLAFGSLDGETEGSHQARNMVDMIANVVKLFDELSDTRASPQIGVEPLRTSPPDEPSRQPSKLEARQTTRAAGAFLGLKTGRSMLAEGDLPAANRSRGDPKLAANCRSLSSCLGESDGILAALERQTGTSVFFHAAT
jgi:hypothetical protein